MQFVIYALLITFYENILHRQNKGIPLFEQHCNDSLSGFDLRHKIEPIDNELTSNLSTYMKKKELLDKLMKKKVNFNEKCKLVEKYDIIQTDIGKNVYNGGLLDDWNYEINNI